MDIDYDEHEGEGTHLVSKMRTLVHFVNICSL
jgi:hypothetical protein